MSMLRSLIVTSSTIQLTLAAGLSWWLLRVEVPDLVSFGLCAVLALTALAGIAAAGGRAGPSLSRRGTARANAVLLGFVLALGATMAIMEHAQGMSAERLVLIGEIAAVAAIPFLVNALALRGLARPRHA